jgi:cytoskeletal protein CcmA (bactofilin family)
MFGKTEKNKTNSNNMSSEVCNIGEGTTIEGVVKVDSNLRLDGNIYGSVTCGGRIVMSASGYIKGDIVCKNMISEGKVEGNILGQEKIHLKATAIVEGNIKYKRLEVDSGASFNGQAICSKSSTNTPSKSHIKASKGNA